MQSFVRGVCAIGLGVSFVLSWPSFAGLLHAELRPISSHELRQLVALHGTDEIKSTIAMQMEDNRALLEAATIDPNHVGLELSNTLVDRQQSLLQQTKVIEAMEQAQALASDLDARGDSFDRSVTMQGTQMGAILYSFYYFFSRAERGRRRAQSVLGRHSPMDWTTREMAVFGAYREQGLQDYHRLMTNRMRNAQLFAGHLESYIQVRHHFVSEVHRYLDEMFRDLRAQLDQLDGVLSLRDAAPLTRAGVRTYVDNMVRERAFNKLMQLRTRYRNNGSILLSESSLNHLYEELMDATRLFNVGVGFVENGVDVIEKVFEHYPRDAQQRPAANRSAYSTQELRRQLVSFEGKCLGRLEKMREAASELDEVLNGQKLFGFSWVSTADEMAQSGSYSYDRSSLPVEELDAVKYNEALRRLKHLQKLIEEEGKTEAEDIQDALRSRRVRRRALGENQYARAMASELRATLADVQLLRQPPSIRGELVMLAGRIGQGMRLKKILTVVGSSFVVWMATTGEAEAQTIEGEASESKAHGNEFDRSGSYQNLHRYYGKPSLAPSELDDLAGWLRENRE